MFSALTPAGLLLAFILTFSAAGAGIGEARAFDEVEATRVGGDLARYGEKLAVLRDANAKVLAAAPRVVSDLRAAWQRIASAPSSRGFTAELAFVTGALFLMTLAIAGVRRATRGPRIAFGKDALPARGGAGVFALDGFDRIAVACVAYLSIELWCDIDTTQDLLAVALVWAFVRWWIAMWLVQALLRPRQPQYRLIPMRDDTARVLTLIAAVALWIGIFAISIMPVLLRAKMPIESAQFIVLVQGFVVALGGLLGLVLYRRREYLQVSLGNRSPRRWFAGGVFALVIVWLAWSTGTLLLDFSVYHSLVWSLRIAAFAYIVDAILSMSVAAQPVAASAGPVATPFARLWIALLHRSIRVAAIVAIAILLAETWLVDELELVARSDWEPVRESLVTAAVTLLAGYVVWRYVSQWTELRLQAVVPLMEEADDGSRAPASRLTTVLPVLRILLGVTIIVLATLVALAQLGVNVAPLIAGAGVIGLAISFGSQALVRDIVSGIFFMADDAFRVGEYIDTGHLKGSVEKISLRSMRLRHQNGQIHTIPFGQLTSVSNFSRDWQTVKFNLRLARNADLERVRRIVNQIGQELMADPEVSKELLQPLKFQGVAEIADTAIVVRLKFTARPGKPNFVQREALKRIHRVFAETGIEFSSNAVTVQTAVPTPVTPQAAAAASAFNAASRQVADAA
jgi:small-conductance mechanosensitive channel